MGHMPPNDEVERRAVAQVQNEADFIPIIDSLLCSPEMIPPRSLEPMVRRRTRRQRSTIAFAVNLSNFAQET
jgi:hypothetical protein